MSHKPEGKKIFTVLAVALLAGFPLLAVGTPVLSAFGPGNNSIPPFTHVFYIMMENNGVPQLVSSSPNAPDPYINYLMSTYGYDNNYYGVTHTSLPNYVAAISGSNWASNYDDPTQTFNHTNLVDQLVAHHISWKGYMEGMPYAGYTGAFYPSSTDTLYVLKHDPFMLFTDIATNPQLADNVVPLTQLTTDLNSNNVPQFVWISPNLCNDMHGGNACTDNTPNGLITQGDNFLKQWVTAITSSKAWTGNSVIFITWDEAAYPSSGASASDISAFTAPGPDSPLAPAAAFAYAGLPTPGTSTYGGQNPPLGGTDLYVYGGGNVPLIVITTQMTGMGHGHSTGPITINTWADHYSILRTIEQSWNLGYLGMASDGSQVQSLTGFFQQSGHHDGGFSGLLQVIETEFSHLRIQRR